MTSSPALPPPLLQTVRTPRSLNRVALAILFVLVLLPIVLALSPWQQTIHGMGSALAFNPVQRPQPILAPIDGRLMRWFVMEGDRVRKGDRLVELADNDPFRLQRLEDEGRAIAIREQAIEQQILQIGNTIQNLELSLATSLTIQDQVIANAILEQSRAEQELRAAQALELEARTQYEVAKDLVPKGAESGINLVRFEQQYNQRKAQSQASRDRVEVSKNNIDQARKARNQIEQVAKAGIERERSNQQGLKGVEQNIVRERLTNQSAVERQRQQFIFSPCDGTIFQITANAEAGGQLVRMGQTLAIIVPEIKPNDPISPPVLEGLAAVAGIATAAVIQNERPWHPDLLADFTAAGGGPAAAAAQLTKPEMPGIVAALLVDGNDLPLIRKGDRVRLQFEGWPAIQFVGWPSVARGTFPGRVFLVDPTSSSASGQFRVLVEPDQEWDRNGDPILWPGPEYLRQGVRCQGWILIEEVRLGWEVFRTLNGFPPVRSKPESSGSSLGPVTGKPAS